MRYQHSTLFAPTNTTNVRRGIRHFFKTGQNGFQAFVISFRINTDQNGFQAFVISFRISTDQNGFQAFVISFQINTGQDGVQPFVISFRINTDQNRKWIIRDRQAYWTPRGVLATSMTLVSTTCGYLGFDEI